MGLERGHVFLHLSPVLHWPRISNKVTLVYIADQKLEVTLPVSGASVDLNRVGATVSKCSFRQTVESVVHGFQHVCFDSPANKEECWTLFFFLLVEREAGFQR